MKRIGIYQLKNKKNNKLYVGQSHDIDRRIQEHFQLLLKGKHKNKRLQDDYDKDGEKAFEVSTLEECEAIDLNRKESEYCYANDVWNAEKGYNIGKLIDYSVMSKEEAIRFKDRFLERLFRTKSRDFRFAINDEIKIFGLDYTKIRIFLGEITKEDEGFYGCSIEVKRDFYGRELELIVRPFEENVSYIEVKEMSDRILQLDNKEKLSELELKEMEELENKLEGINLRNLKLLLSKVPLREKIKKRIVEEFTGGGIKTALTNYEVSNLDLIEDYIEDFLYDGDIKAAQEFCSIVNSYSEDTLYLDDRFE